MSETPAVTERGEVFHMALQTASDSACSPPRKEQQQQQSEKGVGKGGINILVRECKSGVCLAAQRLPQLPWLRHSED